MESQLLLLHLTSHCCADAGPQDAVQRFWGPWPAFRLLEKQGIQKRVTSRLWTPGF